MTPPANITCTINGKEKGSVTADDGVTAVLETPVGRAMAFRRRLESRFQRVFNPLARFATRFPGDNETRFVDPPNLSGLKGTASRVKEYQTEEGRVVIRATETR